MALDTTLGDALRNRSKTPPHIINMGHLMIIMYHWPFNQQHLKERVSLHQKKRGKLHLLAQSQLKERQSRAMDCIIVNELVHHLFRLVIKGDLCPLRRPSLKPCSRRR